MKTLVVGAAGSLTRLLCGSLLSSGFTVRVLSAEPGPAGDSFGLEVEFAEGGTDPESLLAAMSGVNAVFDCGFTAQPWPARERGQALETTANVLVAMARAGVEQLIHVGSAFSFEPGTLSEPGDESAPARDLSSGPDWLSSAKLAQDNALRYNDSGKIRAVVLNPTVILGGGSGSTLGSAVLDGAPSLGQGGINVVGAAQAARACVIALGRGKAGRCYILGGHNVSFARLAELAGPSLQSPPARGDRALRLLRRGDRARAGSPGGLTVSWLGSRTFYYSSARAIAELGLATPSLEELVRGSLDAGGSGGG